MPAHDRDGGGWQIALGVVRIQSYERLCLGAMHRAILIGRIDRKTLAHLLIMPTISPALRSHL